MSKFNTWSYLEQIIFYEKQERHPLVGAATEGNIQNTDETILQLADCF